MKIGIVGSKSYIGSNIIKALEKDGYEIILFDRKIQNQNEDNEAQYYYDLGKAIIDNLPLIDYLIFCSYDLSIKKWNEIKLVNVDSTIEFIQRIQKLYKTEVIYLSSLSAFDGCKSYYGRAKLMIERGINNKRSFILRLGLVYGLETGGIVDKLIKFSSILPFLLLPKSSKNPLYLTKIESIIFIINLIISKKINLKNPLLISDDGPLSLTDTINFLLEKNGKKKPLIYYISDNIFFIFLKISEVLGLPFSSDNLISLIYNKKKYDFTDYNRIKSRHE